MADNSITEFRQVVEDFRKMYDIATEIVTSDDYKDVVIEDNSTRPTFEKAIKDRFNELVKNTGYEYLGDYAEGIEINAYNQIVRDANGEFWKLSGSVNTPYTTSGNGLPEGGNFVAVGDASLRSELETDGSNLINVIHDNEKKTLGEWITYLSDTEENVGDGNIVSTGSNTARLLSDRFADVANPRDFGAIGAPKSLLEEYGSVEAAREAYPSIYIEDGQESLDWAAIQSAVSTGKKVLITAGDYYVNTEIEITTAGQVIEFANTGGYGYGEDIGENWQADNTKTCRIIAGTGRTVPARLRTRRLYKGASNDGVEEQELSVIFNVQAENVHLIRPCVWLRTDYTSNSYGYYIHVGIFVGTRVGVQIHDPIIIGMFRRAGIYIDVSGATNLPRFSDRAGNPYPEGTVKNGADGTHIYNPYIRGSRIGLAVLGALPKNGETGYSTDYYDVISNQYVEDRRGSFGCSDFLVSGGRIYGPDHRDNRRLKDPINNSSGELSNGTLSQEPDDAPAAVYISGLAGNASGWMWGMRFIGTRIATFEAFRMRLKYAARVSLYDCHIEGRNGGSKNVAGATINTNDYTSNSYGDIAAESGAARDILWHGSARQTVTDGAFNHYYAESASLKTDSGRDFIAEGAYIQASKGELDLRAEDGQAIRLRSGTNTAATLTDTEAFIIGAGASTSSAGANVYITSGGHLYRSTSAAKYKTDIRLLSDEYCDKAMTISPVRYRPSNLSDDSQSQEFIGFIADDFDDKGLSEIVFYNEEDGSVEGFDYARMTAVHQNIINRLSQKIEELEARLDNK